MLLCGLFAQAADEDLITEQITINALEAGTLPQRISSSKKNLITNLKIIGEINGTDLKFIHEMAGQDINGFSTDGKLSILDLYDAKIVSGGESYNKFDNHTEDNRIGDYTFYGCSELTSVTLPPSVTSIGHFAFCDCNNLMSVTLPSSLGGMGFSAFEHCNNLTSVALPSEVVYIYSNTFKGCSSLTSVTLPSSLTYIGESTFKGCSSLTSLTLPSSLTTLGKSAFKDCSGLKSLTLSSNITSAGEGAFSGCVELTNVRYDILGDLATYIERGHPSMGITAYCDVNYYHADQELTNLEIPYGVDSIGDRAFENCHDLTNVSFPSSLVKIGNNAFENCI